MKAVICGGGTGGHIYPALAIASCLRADGHEVLYMGGKDSTEAKLAEKSGFAFFGVDACGLHRKSLRIIKDMYLNLCGRKQSAAQLRSFQPAVVIGTGGYASAPIVSAAQKLHIPTMLHEQNAFPGLANRSLARKADAVCLTFAAAEAYFPHPERLHLTGLPVRREILECSRAQAWQYFGISGTEQQRFTLLITGGSLGAASLNKAALAVYQSLLAQGIRIIHICGEKNYFSLRQQLPKHPLLLVLPYLHEMQYALALADLAVARAGASFLSEVACLGLPSILIPYPYAANDHQRYNARAFQDAGAALVIEDGQLSGDVLLQNILPLLQNRERLSQMSTAARKLAQPDSDRKIVEIAYSLIR